MEDGKPETVRPEGESVTPSRYPAQADQKTSEPEAGIPASIFDRGALRFWLAVLLRALPLG